jgi:RES domain-containing protein
MYNLRARCYVPVLGRFTQFDNFPGVHSDPLTLHRYTFGADDPINKIDPSGNISMTELTVTVAILALLTAQWANAPGVGDKGLRNNSDVEVALMFGQGQILATPIAMLGRVVIGVGAGLLLRVSQAGGRLRTLWQKIPVYHATDAATSILKGIDPTRFNPASRFGGAFYVAEEGGTAVAEAAGANQVIRFELNLSNEAVLDLTNPNIARAWGYAEKSSREATQAIAERAREEGYTVIKFFSKEVPGSVNYAIFENFEQVLRPIKVIDVPWTPPPVNN